MEKYFIIKENEVFVALNSLWSFKDEEGDIDFTFKLCTLGFEYSQYAIGVAITLLNFRLELVYYK